MKKAKNAKSSKIGSIISFFLPIILAAVVALILRTYVLANAVVPTGSMLDTIQLNDRIIANRLAYVNDDPERYDIVLFYFPDNEEEIFVKRVIGLPGETVEMVHGVVYVTKTDGEIIQLDSSFVTACELKGNYGPYTVPENSYFMLGDNRNSSEDSRFWNNKYVSKDKILGKVMFKYFPNISKID